MTQSFLIVRPDNIGDLVLTTPLIRAMRETFPEAWIGALVNSYNVAVLSGNPNLNAVYAYQKLKHVSGAAKITAAFEYVRLIASMRNQHIDVALLPSRGSAERSARLARIAGATRLVGFLEAGTLAPNASKAKHEAEDVFELARQFGVEGSPGPCEVFPQATALSHARGTLMHEERPCIAVHISARKPSQRWPIDRYAALMHELHETDRASFALFWAPGSPDNKTHPGDDAIANELLGRVKSLPVIAFPTRDLASLIAGLSLCDYMICSDGGAMHLAAALGKPILCFFGQSDAKRWHPWGVPYELLQPPSFNAADIDVDAALSAFDSLRNKRAI